VHRLLALVSVLAVSTGLGAATGSPAEAGGPARASYTCDGLAATIVGHPRSEVLKGTPGDDVIVARGGDDVVWAGAGDDVVCGDGGRDGLYGGPGDDVLLGGRDQYSVTACGDCVPQPQVTGDHLVPGPGRDRLVGGYDPRQATTDAAYPDTVDYSKATGPVVVRLAAPGDVGVATGQGRDRIAGQPSMAVVGSVYDDRLVGSSGIEWLIGRAGADVIRGQEGDDYLLDRGTRSAVDTELLSAGPGDDRVEARGGVTTILLGSGDDSLLVAPRCVTAVPGAGVDRLTLSNTRITGPQLSFTFDAGAGRLHRPTGAPACGAFGPFESYVLEGGSAQVGFLGTEGPDVLEARAPVSLPTSTAVTTRCSARPTTTSSTPALATTRSTPGTARTCVSTPR
jgi:Ca2+-binding RTX toxin-like protein